MADGRCLGVKGLEGAACLWRGVAFSPAPNELLGLLGCAGVGGSSPGAPTLEIVAHMRGVRTPSAGCEDHPVFALCRGLRPAVGFLGEALGVRGGELCRPSKYSSHLGDLCTSDLRVQPAKLAIVRPWTLAS
mmetsp:Transcript_85857/g.237830  ORF Transcript_85857/g.237830 Transcript_85857/m.237830 type:complete len:132 (-) Transcript_85857:369-764(-)